MTQPLQNCIGPTIRIGRESWMGQSGRIGTMRDGGTLQKYFFENKKFHIFSFQINLSTL